MHIMCTHVRTNTYAHTFMYKHVRTHIYAHTCTMHRATAAAACIYLYAHYGVAWISRLLKIIGLFCKRVLSKRPYSAKETYNSKEPTNRSHPIHRYMHT